MSETFIPEEGNKEVQQYLQPAAHWSVSKTAGPSIHRLIQKLRVCELLLKTSGLNMDGCSDCTIDLLDSFLTDVWGLMRKRYWTENSRNLRQNQISFSAGDDKLCWVWSADVMFESRGDRLSDSSSGKIMNLYMINHELIYDNL